jgi:hypothetical protein
MSHAPLRSSWRTLARVLVLSLVVMPLAQAADSANTVYGLEIMPWAKRLEEGRYQSPRDYEATKKFFKDNFKGWKSIRWHAEVSLPSVKYIHVENTAVKRSWDGVNIYELPGGQVRIFVLRHVPPATSSATPTKSDAAKGDAKSDAPKAP